MQRRSRVKKQVPKLGLRSPGQTAETWALMDYILGLPPFRLVRRLLGNTKIIERAAVAVFLIGVLLTLALSIARPAYNWDMVAYVASALEKDHPNPVDLHRETWVRIDAKADDAQQFHLKRSDPYNLHQWENPVDFQSQLSMYRVKIGYIALLKTLDPYVGLVMASVVLSVVPALIFGLICLWWLWREDALQGALVLLPSLFLADYFTLTALVTPDMLVATVSFAALFCLYRKHDWSAALLLVASVFIRPDNFVLIIALTITAVLFGWRRMPMSVTFVAATLLMTAMSKYAGHPGWWPHFYFSTVQMQNSMADFRPAFSLIDFAIGYARGLVFSFQYNDWPSLYLLLLTAWAWLFKSGRMAGGRSNALCFAMAIGVAGKFASFPLPDDRYYFMFIAGFMMILIIAWKPQFHLERIKG